MVTKEIHPLATQVSQQQQTAAQDAWILLKFFSGIKDLPALLLLT